MWVLLWVLLLKGIRSLSSFLLPLLSFFFSLSLGDDTKWPTKVDVSFNLNTINQILNGKQSRSRSIGFWIYTVCKGRAYPGSTGPWLIFFLFIFRQAEIAMEGSWKNLLWVEHCCSWSRYYHLGRISVQLTVTVSANCIFNNNYKNNSILMLDPAQMSAGCDTLGNMVPFAMTDKTELTSVPLIPGVDYKPDISTLQVTKEVLAPFKRKAAILKKLQSDPDALKKYHEGLTSLDASSDTSCDSSNKAADTSNIDIELYQDSITEQMSPDSQLSPSSYLTHQHSTDSLPAWSLSANNMSDNKPCNLSEIGVTRPSHILPPCRVCGDKASGFHYGANTCEACKVSMSFCPSIEDLLRTEIRVSKEFTMHKNITDKSKSKNWECWWEQLPKPVN